MENNNDLFEFLDNDIYSSAAQQHYEDIVSDSRLKGKHYAKKKRGNRLTLWWGRRKKWQKAVMISALSLVLVFTLAAGIFLNMFDYNYNAITSNPEELGFESVIDKKIVNVALFGIDAREVGSFKGLSDSIMILSLNTETKKVKVISVMRDSLVPITYNGKTVYGKINSAYSKGGPELAIKTLNTVFGLDISEYATVNFYGMSDIIDAVGGIDVTLTEGELNAYGYENGVKIYWGLNGCIAEQCAYMGLNATDYYVQEAGLQHLNGVQAVAYARIRHAANIEGTNDDYGRTDRQRYVMEQLFNKAVTLNTTQYISLAKSLIPCSETSLSYSDIMGLAVNILLSSPTFEQSRIPLTEYQIGSKSVSGYGSCVYYDLDYASKLLKAFIYDDITPEDYMEINGIEKNDWYANRYSSQGGSSSSKTSSSSSASSSKTSSSSLVSQKPSSSSGTVSEDESSKNTVSSEPTESLEPTEPNAPPENDKPETPDTDPDKPEEPDKPTDTDKPDKPETPPAQES